MAVLTKNDTKKVAELAKLKLTPSEIDKFTKQLSKVVEYISQLDEVNTSSVEPTSQTTGLINVLRNDEIDTTKILTQDEALSGTDKTQNGFFVVPQILHK